jgi:hypothetical protein
MSLNKYLNPSFSGTYCQAVINAIESQYTDADTILSYMSNLSLDNADDTAGDNTTNLAQLGLIIGYPRPTNSLFATPSGYLDAPTYILLLKQIATIKYNGMAFYNLDYIVYQTLYVGGGITNYTISYSNNGKSSPNGDYIINIGNQSNPKWEYILQTVLSLFLNQGIVVNIISNPFVFAKWDTGSSSWVTNPLGKGFSRLQTSFLTDNSGNVIVDNSGRAIVITNSNNIADTNYGGKLYAVI